MAQFYSVTWAGDLNGTRVLNTVWYRSEAVGLPTDADLDAVEDEFQVNGWPTLRPILTSQYRLKQTIVQGYTDDFVREPYLPMIRDYDAPGNVAAASAPPIMCAILSFRVVPRRPGPHKRSNGTFVDLPVRRGYLSISGISDAVFNANGSVDPTFINSGSAQAVATWARTERDIATMVENLKPVRVSEHVKERPRRGYGDVAGSIWRPEASSRRSRKLGKGV